MSIVDKSHLLSFAHWGEDEFFSENWGVALHDLDRNGYLDFAANHHSEGRGEIIMNLGSGEATNVSFPAPGDLHSMTFFDVDQDGDADLLQAVGARGGTAVDETDERIWSKVHLNNGGVLEVENSVGRFGFAYGPGSGRLITPINFDGALAVYVGVQAREGKPNGAYSGQIFVRDATGAYNPENPVGGPIAGEFVKGAHFGGDRYVDILNLNRGARDLLLYENEGGGFGPGVLLAENATDVVSADFDGDLMADILVGYSGKEESLFRRQGLEDWSETARVVERPGGKGWTIIAHGDFDNDGDVDYASVQRRPGVDIHIHLNRGDGVFTSSGRYVDPTVRGVTEFAIVGDVDRDGALDLIVTTSNGEERLEGEYVLLSSTPNGNNWLSVELEGVVSERGGLGARVYATTADGVTRVLEQDSGTHYIAQNATDLHFGLGQNTRADLRIVWPDGYEQVVAGVEANQHIVVREVRLPAETYTTVIDGSSGRDDLQGTSGRDLIRGLGAADLLSGLAGADRVEGGDGGDRLFGQGGADVIVGGAGWDRQTGGGGADVFVFAAGADSLPDAADVIKDFVRKVDRVDLSGLDADAADAGVQEFVFIGRAVFSGKAGELRSDASLVEADTNGDGGADFRIELLDVTRLTTADLIL